MDRARRQQLLEAHDAFARAIRDELTRLWQRPLTAQEINIVADGTLCQSFMSLESIVNGLHVANTPERADEEFQFIRTQVDAHRQDVIREMTRRLKGTHPDLPNPDAYPNLIEWERVILMR